MIRLASLTVLGMMCVSVHAQTTSSLSLQPITLDCTKAVEMSTELESIINNPGRKNSTWDSTLAWVGGIATPEQRQASAKTVLWNIRTQCRGF